MMQCILCHRRIWPWQRRGILLGENGGEVHLHCGQDLVPLLENIVEGCTGILHNVSDQYRIMAELLRDVVGKAHGPLPEPTVDRDARQPVRVRDILEKSHPEA